MDLTILYLLLLPVLTIGLVILVRYLNNKGLIKSEDLILIMTVFGLSLKVVKELKLEKEKEILKIGDIAYDTVEYVYAIYSYVSENELYDLTDAYIRKQFDLLGIELTENRMDIVDTLIQMGLESKFVKMGD